MAPQRTNTTAEIVGNEMHIRFRLERDGEVLRTEDELLIHMPLIPAMDEPGWLDAELEGWIARRYPEGGDG